MTVILVFATSFSDWASLHSEIKSQYSTAFATFRSVIKNIYILETRKYMQAPETYVIHVSSCDNYFLLNIDIGKGDVDYRFCLTNQSWLNLSQNKATKAWALRGYALVKSEVDYNTYKNEMTSLTPYSMTYPFREINELATVDDILHERMINVKRKSRQIKLHYAAPLATDNKQEFRLIFSIKFIYEDKTKYGYVDLSRDYGWQIVRGRVYINEWENEYMNRINGYPIISRIYSRSINYDAKQDKDIVTPNIEITVYKAEYLASVNRAEYEPAFYGIEIPPDYFEALAGNNSARIPPAFYAVVFGLVCFILGVLLIHYSKRRAKKVLTV
jgi:hypothetical protein